MEDPELQQRLAAHLGRSPTIHPTAWVHPAAVVAGDVRLGPRSSVWPMAVLRGDINRIDIAEGVNIQDGTVVHLSDDSGVEIQPFCTIGHQATIHACVVEAESLVGIQATVLDEAVIGRNSIVGAKALVTRGARIPPESLVLGVPAKVVRSLTAEEIEETRRLARKYIQVAAAHREKGG